MLKKVMATWLLSGTLFISGATIAHAEVTSNNGMIVSNSQIPSSISFYWDYWREVKLTQPVEAKLIHYPNESSVKIIVTKTKIIPANTIIYVHGFRSYSPPSKSYFAITESKNNAIYGKTIFKVTTPFWTVNYNDIVNFELTSNNDVVTKINVKAATSNTFTKDKWQSGYLSLSELLDGLTNNEILAKSYSDLKQYQKLNRQYELADIGSSKETQIKKQMNRVLKTKFINYSGKNITKSFKVRSYNDRTVQVKMGQHIYYATNKNILPYNTTSNNGISSLEKPTPDGLKHIVLRAGDSIYNTNYQTWQTWLMDKSGRLSKSKGYSYIFDGKHWYHRYYDGQKWHQKLLKS
ncbi:hypothetical protein [Lactobacillus sp. Sy-1]|uniref:hypothetical protein n=1 Tax=Lactobacillus sp. Sy-1 TaxID=2109645 RepID=UPI001C5B090B|nr:hypothetical protein [Lactobacillus sp. Sy-1]MBW1606345.1 hypothetical protein [Lactobacillus sp. Sy-1]